MVKISSSVVDVQNKKATFNVLNNLVYETSNLGASQKGNIKYRSAIKPRLVSKSSNGLNPKIIDYMDSYFDFSLSATSYFENVAEILNNCKKSESWRELLQYDGCAEVQNRTQLYLSTRIYKLDANGNLDPAQYNTPVRDHITNPWDSNIVGSITNSFLFFEYWSKDKLYDESECIYKPCLYQVITAGASDAVGPSPFLFNGPEKYNKKASRAKRYLAIRTIIDNIFVRFYQFLFEMAGTNVSVDQAREIGEIVYNYSPKITEEVNKLLVLDNPTEDDFKKAGYEMLKELYNNEFLPVIPTATNPVPSFGPLTKQILKALKIDAEEIITLLLARAAEKWIPFYGQLSAAYDVAKTANIVIEFGSTIKDFMVVPTKADFSLTWGLSIVDISPRTVAKDSFDKKIKIYGIGFNVIEGWIWDTKPEFTFTDSNNSTLQYKTTNVTVSEQGNLATLMLPADFINGVTGSIEVKVDHDQESAKSPYNIKIGSELSITRLLPNTAKQGDLITIEGSGFSEVVSKNTVEFTGGSTVVRAIVISATKNELKVVVPSGARTGDVSVLIGTGKSNGLLFTVPHLLKITYGDNGQLNDDIFKLKVNSEVIYDNNKPLRNIGPLEIALTKGTHTVELEGIRADDGIGTYFISFDGDVLNVSGDALEGRDLCPQIVKRFQVEVGLGAGNKMSAKAVKNKVKALQSEVNSIAECLN